MSLREFLREEKQVRKQMREERKQNKKQPKTTREKVYKVVGILFTIAVICGAFMYACSNMSGGYDWNTITGINNEIIQKLESDVDKSLIVGDFELTKANVDSCKEKFLNAGIDYSKINESADFDLSSSIYLNSGEAGVIVQDILSEVNGENNKYELIAFKMYSDTTYVYEVSVMKVCLSKYINNANLPDVYISTKSKCEVQNENLTALNYITTINNLDIEECQEILDILNKNILVSDLKKIATDDVNSAINALNVLLGTKLYISSDSVSFIKK